MPERFELDLAQLNPKSLSPAQWNAILVLASERARRERAKAIRGFFRALRTWFRGKRVFPPILRSLRLPLGASLGRS